MASPAQVSNDMAVRSGFWRGRDPMLHKACFDAAVMIRCFLNGAPPDGRSFYGLDRRLLRLESSISDYGNAGGIREALSRARLTLQDLREEAQR